MVKFSINRRDLMTDHVTGKIALIFVENFHRKSKKENVEMFQDFSVSWHVIFTLRPQSRNVFGFKSLSDFSSATLLS